MGDSYQNGRIATLFRIAPAPAAQPYADAVLNGLLVDRHQEEAVVDLFAQKIDRPGDEFLSHPMQTPLVPNRNRVINAFPRFREQF